MPRSQRAEKPQLDSVHVHQRRAERRIHVLGTVDQPTGQPAEPGHFLQVRQRCVIAITNG